MKDVPDALFQLYYTAFFTGFSVSFATFYAVNFFLPIKGAGEYDEYDNWATFSPEEAARIGVVPNDYAEQLFDTRFGASGYECHPTRAKEPGLEVGRPLPVEISMGTEKAR
jgi:hypothetical protein